MWPLWLVPLFGALTGGPTAPLPVTWLPVREQAVPHHLAARFSTAGAHHSVRNGLKSFKPKLVSDFQRPVPHLHRAPFFTTRV